MIVSFPNRRVLALVAAGLLAGGTAASVGTAAAAHGAAASCTVRAVTPKVVPFGQRVLRPLNNGMRVTMQTRCTSAGKHKATLCLDIDKAGHGTYTKVSCQTSSVQIKRSTSFITANVAITLPCASGSHYRSRVRLDTGAYHTSAPASGCS